MSFIWMSPYMWFGIAIVAAAISMLYAGGSFVDLLYEGDLYGLFEIIWDAIIPG